MPSRLNFNEAQLRLLGITGDPKKLLAACRRLERAVKDVEAHGCALFGGSGLGVRGGNDTDNDYRSEIYDCGGTASGGDGGDKDGAHDDLFERIAALEDE